MYRAILSARGPVYFHFIIVALARSHASAAIERSRPESSPTLSLIQLYRKIIVKERLMRMRTAWNLHYRLCATYCKRSRGSFLWIEENLRIIPGSFISNLVRWLDIVLRYCQWINMRFSRGHALASFKVLWPCHRATNVLDAWRAFCDNSGITIFVSNHYEAYRTR